MKPVEERISNLLGEGLGIASAEGFVGGAAMVAGSIVASKIAQKLAERKVKRKQIQAIQDQIKSLRDQMKNKDEVGKANIKKRIYGLDARIQQIKSQEKQ